METKKYNDPLNQIQDQIGGRIIVYYLDDAKEIKKIVEDYFGELRYEKIIPDSEKEFGYEGEHFILLIPEDLYFDDIITTIIVPPFLNYKFKLSTNMHGQRQIMI